MSRTMTPDVPRVLTEMDGRHSPGLTGSDHNVVAMDGTRLYTTQALIKPGARRSLDLGQPAFKGGSYELLGQQLILTPSTTAPTTRTSPRPRTVSPSQKTASPEPLIKQEGPMAPAMAELLARLKRLDALRMAAAGRTETGALLQGGTTIELARMTDTKDEVANTFGKGVTGKFAQRDFMRTRDNWSSNTAKHVAVAVATPRRKSVSRARAPSLAIGRPPTAENQATYEKIKKDPLAKARWAKAESELTSRIIYGKTTAKNDRSLTPRSYVRPWDHAEAMDALPKDPLQGLGGTLTRLALLQTKHTQVMEERARTAARAFNA